MIQTEHGKSVAFHFSIAAPFSIELNKTNVMDITKWILYMLSLKELANKSNQHTQQ